MNLSTAHRKITKGQLWQPKLAEVTKGQMEDKKTPKLRREITAEIFYDTKNPKQMGWHTCGCGESIWKEKHNSYSWQLRTILPGLMILKSRRESELYKQTKQLT